MNSEISIGKLVELISEIMNIELQIETSDDRIRPKNSEVERLVCDNEKLLKNTDWKPKYTLKDGLTNVIRWMEDPKNLNIYKAEQYNV